jgi:hypothetical protein
VLALIKPFRLRFRSRPWVNLERIAEYTDTTTLSRGALAIMVRVENALDSTRPLGLIFYILWYTNRLDWTKSATISCETRWWLKHLRWLVLALIKPFRLRFRSRPWVNLERIAEYTDTTTVLTNQVNQVTPFFLRSTWDYTTKSGLQRKGRFRDLTTP